MNTESGVPNSERRSLVSRLFANPQEAGDLVYQILPPDSHLMVDFSRPPEYIEGTAISFEQHGKQLDALYKVWLHSCAEEEHDESGEAEHALVYVMVDFEYVDDEQSKSLAVENIERAFRGETSIELDPADQPVWVLPVLFCPTTPAADDLPHVSAPSRAAVSAWNEAGGGKTPTVFSPVSSLTASKTLH